LLCARYYAVLIEFFSSFFVAAINSTNEANKAAGTRLKQSIYLDVYAYYCHHEACTINVSRSVIDNSRSIIDDSRSVIDNSRSIIDESRSVTDKCK
jgi:hypothetical protein